MASIFKRGGRKGKGGYFVAYSERPGLRRTVYAGRDRAAAEALGRHLESQAMLRAAGVIDERADRWAAAEARPLAEQVADFGASLAAAAGRPSTSPTPSRTCGGSSRPALGPASASATPASPPPAAGSRPICGATLPCANGCNRPP